LKTLPLPLSYPPLPLTLFLPGLWCSPPQAFLPGEGKLKDVALSDNDTPQEKIKAMRMEVFDLKKEFTEQLEGMRQYMEEMGGVRGANSSARFVFFVFCAPFEVLLVTVLSTCFAEAAKGRTHGRKKCKWSTMSVEQL
jgi:hypothetical protein